MEGEEVEREERGREGEEAEGRKEGGREGRRELSRISSLWFYPTGSSLRRYPELRVATYSTDK